MIILGSDEVCRFAVAALVSRVFLLILACVLKHFNFLGSIGDEPRLLLKEEGHILVLLPILHNEHLNRIRSQSLLDNLDILILIDNLHNPLGPFLMIYPVVAIRGCSLDIRHEIIAKFH
jgi:hypothetical protein